ncbi:MAG: hypothetical protein CXZ00_11910 [Acidobacteria bacterium]|nr:MAG: hypothetical protein CXZ00_11910 [Acidobacteriota bacterium]
MEENEHENVRKFFKNFKENVQLEFELHARSTTAARTSIRESSASGKLFFIGSLPLETISPVLIYASYQNFQ